MKLGKFKLIIKRKRKKDGFKIITNHEKQNICLYVKYCKIQQL